ncbi:MAG: CopD family protein [Saprospiraceae bacterium]|nr:CopD family protein [Saprospiraceae bacterium]
MEIANWYSVAKSLHLVGMVSWMAGMFYLVRIMVNHAMAFDRQEPDRSILKEQYVIMEWKSYNIILKPAVVITWSFGVMMLFIQPVWLSQGWMQLKLFFLLLLTGYTHYLKGHIKQLEAGTSSFTHIHYRALNEVPTVFLVAIVFLAVFRDRINYLMLFGGLVFFIGLMAWGIKKANSKGGG